MKWNEPIPIIPPKWWTLDPSSDVEIKFGDHNEDRFLRGFSEKLYSLICDPYISIRKNKVFPSLFPGPWHDYDLAQDEECTYAKFTKLEDESIKVEIYRSVAPDLGIWELSKE